MLGTCTVRVLCKGVQLPGLREALAGGNGSGAIMSIIVATVHLFGNTPPPAARVSVPNQTRHVWPLRVWCSGAHSCGWASVWIAYSQWLLL